MGIQIQYTDLQLRHLYVYITLTLILEEGVRIILPGSTPDLTTGDYVGVAYPHNVSRSAEVTVNLEEVIVVVAVETGEHTIVHL